MFWFFVTVSGQQPSMAEHDHNVLFIFGDSLFDGGNNKYINNNSYEESNYPYGYTFFTSATGRACDGRIVPDFIGKQIPNTSNNVHIELLLLSAVGSLTQNSCLQRSTRSCLLFRHRCSPVQTSLMEPTSPREEAPFSIHTVQPI